jgi:hypothetical protein
VLASTNLQPATGPTGNDGDTNGFVMPGVIPVADAPAIAWSANYGGSLLPPSPPAHWQQDFVNHLARSEAQRNPNAALKLQVDLSPKLTAASRGIEPLV